MPNLGPCWCSKLLTSILHDAPYREAGLWPTLECPDHGAWTDPQVMWIRLHETMETLDAMEARAIKAEQRVQELGEALREVRAKAEFQLSERAEDWMNPACLGWIRTVAANALEGSHE